MSKSHNIIFLSDYNHVVCINFNLLGAFLGKNGFFYPYLAISVLFLFAIAAEYVNS